MAEKDKPRPARAPNLGAPPAWILAYRLVDLAETFLKLILSSATLGIGVGALVALYTVSLFAVQPTDRPKVIADLHGTLKTIEATISSSALAWSGWGLLIISWLAGGFFMLQQHKRIRKQGEELADCRKRHDPERLSSEDPQQLELYSERARRKYDGNDD